MNKPFTFKTTKDFAVKPTSGFDKVPQGSEVTVVWDDNGKPTVTIPSLKAEPFKLGNKSVAIMAGKKPPTLATLERWNRDGVCKTVLGTKTEPDGYGHHGEPSWLLVYGLI